MFETTFSEALKLIKRLKLILCYSCQNMNDYQYDTDYLYHNEEVYDFTT